VHRKVRWGEWHLLFEEDDPFHGVAEFPDVPRPLILRMNASASGKPAEPFLKLFVEAAHEEAEEGFEYPPGVPGRGTKADHVEAKVEVVPEFSLFHLTLQVLVRRGDKPTSAFFFSTLPA
jgi:hypothetical protein